MNTSIFTFNVIKRVGCRHTKSVMRVGAKSPYEAGLFAAKVANESESPYVRMDCCRPDFTIVKRDGIVKKLTRNIESIYSDSYIKGYASSPRLTAHIIQ